MDIIDEDDLELKYEDDFEVLKDLEESQCFDNNSTIDDFSQISSSANSSTKNNLQPDINTTNSENVNLLSNIRKRSQPIESELDSFLSIADFPSRDADCPRKKQKIDDKLSDENGSLETLVTDLTTTNAVRVSFENLINSSVFWEKQKITGSNGHRIYLHFRPEETQDVDISCTWKRSGHLLGVPFDVFKEQVMTEYLQNIVDTEDRNDGTSNERVDNSNRKEPNAKEADVLWVEKYKPQQYLELLSDDGINRTLLRWLKLWDKVVFGKEPKKRMKAVQNTKPKFQQRPQFQNFNKFTLEFNKELDALNRPELKVALLCGSPGLGKTTLAHVIAVHAGYNVVEMNASDDRSPEMFRSQLETSTQMKAVLGADPRPNCLVIDEIDGAPAASINLLVSMLKSTGPVRGKRKKGDLPIILRPIICICNDLYAPALKPLRQIALVLNFPPTMPSQLVLRLQEIVKQQKIDAGLSVLLALCEKSGNDIRSCLSTLQFISSRRKQLRISDIKSLTVGQKDAQKTIFAVWKEVFQLPRAKRKDNELKSFATSNEDNGRQDLTPTRFFTMLNSVHCCGDYEKLMSGLFENYLTIATRDSQMASICRGTEWLEFYDIIQQEISHTQLYTLLTYAAYPAVAFHMLFAMLRPSKITFPYSQTEAKTKRSQLESIAVSMLNDVSVQLRNYINISNIILELLPALLYIIQPPVRPVNIQLFSEQERQQLTNVIQIMTAYNLGYRQERSLEGTYHYVIEPNVEELVTFPGSKPILSLTYATKQLIARELEVAKMRENELSSRKVMPKTKKAPTTEAPVSSPVVVKTAVVEKPPVDFFGRIIKKASPENKSTESTEIRKKEVWFQFKEGYSNAVRKAVRISDFL